jgi:hypothetical protein
MHESTASAALRNFPNFAGSRAPAGARFYEQGLYQPVDVVDDTAW